MDKGFSGDEGEDAPERNIFKKGAKFIQTSYEWLCWKIRINQKKSEKKR